MPKRNIYLSDDDIELWDSLPKGQRGRMLRDFLLDRKLKEVEAITGAGHSPVENMSEIEKEREEIRHKIILLEEKQLTLNKERDKIFKNIKSKEYSLHKLNNQLSKLDKDYSDLEEQEQAIIQKYEEKFGTYSDTDNLVITEDVWGHIIVEAKKKVGEIFTYPPKPENGLFFKIKSVKNGKIEVERLDHSSGPSSSIITFRIIQEIIDKFNREAVWEGQAEARIKSGLSFLSDHSIEAAIVLLYRRMEYQGEWIIFSEWL